MSGGYGYPQRPPVVVPRVVAAVLLAAAGLLAVGGSFAALTVYRFESQFTPASTTTTTGWGRFEDPVPEDPVPVPVVPVGIPLTVAAVLVLVAALLLVLSARRPGDPGVSRPLGAGAAGVLFGVVSVIWVQLVATARNVAAAMQERDTDSGIRSSYEFGAGAYLVLVAALLALAAAVPLLVQRTPRTLPPGPGVFPALGPGSQPPPWPPAPQPWPPPGPGAPPPGWGPPPHHG